MSELDYVRSAILEQADLSAFKEKPTLRILAGVFAIGFSFVMGWPAIAALGILSVKLQNPWIVAIGGPFTYGLSHLVFLFGMYLSGAKYSSYLSSLADQSFHGKIARLGKPITASALRIVTFLLPH